MAREAEFKKQRVFNTSNEVAKLVWTNANMVNHANQFVPRSVQLNVGRPNINSVRPNINAGRPNINSVRPNINTGRTNVNPVRPRVYTSSSNVKTVRTRQLVPVKTSNSFSPKRPQGNWGSAVKTSAGYNWRNSKPHSNCDNGPIFFRTDNMGDRGILDSGCSGHMTGNKDQLEDCQQSQTGLFISQDKYVAGMLKKFDLASVKTTITPMETKMALTKDEENSDYAGANLDRKSTTSGCQFLRRRLISWQCKKQTIVATSTTEAEYVAAANCCGQILWIQNQLLDYGFNFMNTKIHIDNESTICIVKNPVFHSKIKHIEIRHHFIRDAYERKLIQVQKIHTNNNVAGLLTKAFDGPRPKQEVERWIGSMELRLKDSVEVKS
ncbi:hypothetical protein Tco_0798159 [Tanacetum coccineum]